LSRERGVDADAGLILRETLKVLGLQADQITDDPAP
jgi:hypothetical protein